jgi:antibiotic biosynthesis monooxygenase (ABM) superfamily enzyme
MEIGPAIMVVGTECPPEVEEEWNRWYSAKHVPDILKFKGIRKATRYKIIDDKGEYPKYLAIYEFESPQAAEAWNTSPERDAVMRDFNDNWVTRGAKIEWRVQYEPMKTWQK